MSIPASGLPANVLDALRRGDVIEAIKLLRASTGLGLKEAKDAIDQHLRGKPVGMVAAYSGQQWLSSVPVICRSPAHEFGGVEEGGEHPAHAPLDELVLGVAVLTASVIKSLTRIGFTSKV